MQIEFQGKCTMSYRLEERIKGGGESFVDGRMSCRYHLSYFCKIASLLCSSLDSIRLAAATIHLILVSHLAIVPGVADE